jgi:hypothetical protein
MTSCRISTPLRRKVHDTAEIMALMSDFFPPGSGWRGPEKPGQPVAAEQRGRIEDRAHGANTAPRLLALSSHLLAVSRSCHSLKGL